MPAPKLFRSLPDGSNSRTGASRDPAQEFAPHRSAIHMWPPGATNTALVDPIDLPSGSLNQLSIIRYGLGWKLDCAPAGERAMKPMTPPIRAKVVRMDLIV